MYNIDIINVIRTHLGASAHDVVHWGNASKWHTALCSPWWHRLFYQFILLCCLTWFYACKFHICLPIAAHGLWEWFIILSLFAQLTYFNVLYWIVRLYYYGFLVNEGICLILVIHIFYPSALSVFYRKDVSPTSSAV